MNRNLSLTSLFASAAMLSACGGGGAPDVPSPAPSALDAVSPQASQSAAGLKKFLGDLATMQVEDGEPVDLGTFTPPLADDTEPETVS